MIKYVDKQGVSKIGEKLKANKTAIEGALELVSTLSGKVEEIEIKWGEVTGFAQRLEEVVGCKTS